MGTLKLASACFMVDTIFTTLAQFRKNGSGQTTLAPA